ncbi:uncharacterized protein LOC119655274 isoform X2 [Hermetia illucens]|uniref:uncharacterized protein LOC119655274 isoform X2 n=1 Tax=Hermetia illucens TaxID=343691 RepID=UPI0018CC047B|nr:uncharacterized protein LOC119655274 isoform X2 [Hermetia illucens]
MGYLKTLPEALPLSPCKWIKWTEMKSQSLIMEYSGQLLSLLLVVVAETVTSEKNQTQLLPHQAPIVWPQLSIVSGNEEITNQEITVEEGEEVEFGCSMSVSENTQLKIVWWKNGERVNSGPNGIQIDNGSIAIPSVEHHHHGLYQCIPENWGEDPPHASVTINVKHKQTDNMLMQPSVIQPSCIVTITQML